MSNHLVKRWRRIARDWHAAANNLEPRRQRGPCEPAAIACEQIDCRARAEVLEDCAASLERSIARAKRDREGGK